MASDIIWNRRVANLPFVELVRPLKETPGFNDLVRSGLQHHQRDPTRVPQRGASEIAPNLQQSVNAHVQTEAQYGAAPYPLAPQIPLGSKIADFGSAPNMGAPRLVTTATLSAPLPEGANLQPLNVETGPFAPGLGPIQTMLPPFVRVIDYRRYRLDNTEPVPNKSELRHLYRLKTQIDGLYPTLGTYNSAKPIELFGFLSTLKEALNAYGTLEAVPVRALTYFLAIEAKDVYQEQVDPGALDSCNALEATWPYVFNALIRRFLSDDLLQSAYDAVVRASQGPSKDEIRFAQRLTDAARECCHVFQPMKLVNSYVCGLHEATREHVQEQVKRLPLKERVDLVTVRKIAAAEGRAQRALLGQLTGRLWPLRKASARFTTRTPTFLMGPQMVPSEVMFPSPRTMPTTATSFYEPGPVEADLVPVETQHETDQTPNGDPVSIIDAAVLLDTIFFAGHHLLGPRNDRGKAGRIQLG